jgi:ATP-binding cassette subfamily B protein
MTARIRDILHWLSTLIDGFQPAEGPPPRMLWPFMRWCLAGAWPVIVLASVLSGLAGVMEVGAAWLLGVLVDSTLAGTDGYFAESAGLIVLYVLFYLVLRPLFFGTSAAFNGIVLPPNLSPLIQSRLHRWSLGHSVTFFDNDFAGRIAQKQMQTATALVNVVTEVINAGAFAVATLDRVGRHAGGDRLAYRSGAPAVAGGVCRDDPLVLPRIRVRSKARAAARANVTGQIVDTITNIKTVKLFGHTEHEDEAAIDALQGYRQTALAFGYLSTGLSVRPDGDGGAVARGSGAGSDRAVAERAGHAGRDRGDGRHRHADRADDGLGQFHADDRLRQCGRGRGRDAHADPAPHADRCADAVELPRIRGRIAYEGVNFAYGRQVGGVAGIDLVIEPGQKLGIVGASGAGKSTLVSLLLRLYDTEEGRVTLDGTDIRTVTQDSLRHQIAMVTQETAMFNRSAMENIRYGRPCDRRGGLRRRETGGGA